MSAVTCQATVPFERRQQVAKKGDSPCGLTVDAMSRRVANAEKNKRKRAAQTPRLRAEAQCSHRVPAHPGRYCPCPLDGRRGRSGPRGPPRQAEDAETIANARSSRGLRTALSPWPSPRTSCRGEVTSCRHDRRREATLCPLVPCSNYRGRREVACHALGPRATTVGGLGHGDEQKPRSRLLTERGRCGQDCRDRGGEATLPPLGLHCSPPRQPRPRRDRLSHAHSRKFSQFRACCFGIPNQTA